jgi:hypothetical protein
MMTPSCPVMWRTTNFLACRNLRARMRQRMGEPVASAFLPATRVFHSNPGRPSFLFVWNQLTREQAKGKGSDSNRVRTPNPPGSLV